MERKITIGNKELRLRSSLFTIIAYKNEFGTDLFQDVSKMDIKDEEGNTPDISMVVRTLFQVIYILNKPFNKAAFDEFLMDFDFDVLSNTETLTKTMQVVGELLGATKNRTNNNKTPYKGTKPHTNK